MNKLIHFHSGDSRFCGSHENPRQFSLDENDITCPDCMGNDRLILTEQGQEFVSQIERTKTEVFDSPLIRKQAD